MFSTWYHNKNNWTIQYVCNANSFLTLVKSIFQSVLPCGPEHSYSYVKTQSIAVISFFQIISVLLQNSINHSHLFFSLIISVLLQNSIDQGLSFFLSSLFQFFSKTQSITVIRFLSLFQLFSKTQSITLIRFFLIFSVLLQNSIDRGH